MARRSLIAAATGATLAVAATTLATAQHGGHKGAPAPAAQPRAAQPRSAQPRPAQPSGAHAGHGLPAGNMPGHGMPAGGSAGGSMVSEGMLTQSGLHSKAALRSLNQLESALRDLEMGQDRAAAMARAKRALEDTRQHVGRNLYTIGLGGDVLMLERNPGRAAPHLGGSHEERPPAGPASGAQR